MQNRNKLIGLFIGNISNSIVHSILEKAIKNDEIVNRYRKESINSLDIAIKYRQKINPIKGTLNIDDISYIKDKIAKRAESELLSRIRKGYKGIDLDSIEKEVEELLRKLDVI